MAHFLNRAGWNTLRLVGSVLSPSGSNARLSILIYHRVLPDPDPLLPGEVDAAQFEKQVAVLKKHFHVLPLYEAIQRLRQKTLPTRSVCITFDDGYRDNYEIALPILQRYGVPATFFIATGFLNGGRMWNDTLIEAVRKSSGSVLDLTAMGLGKHDITSTGQRRQTIDFLITQFKYKNMQERDEQVENISQLASAALSDTLMMSSEQVCALRKAGMEIGGHTVNHPILARLNQAQAQAEILEGKKFLENLLNEPVRLFAYPNGKPGQDYAPEHVEMISNLGFEAAVSTAWGSASTASDRYQLPRFTPWDKDPMRFAIRLLQNLTRAST